MDTLTIYFKFGYECRQREAFRRLAEGLAKNKVSWLRPLSTPGGRWLIDFEELKRGADKCLDLISWTSGHAVVHPQWETEEVGTPERDRQDTTVWFEYPDDHEPDKETMFFPELQPHLDQFQIDHPDAKKTAFVMMRFADTGLQTAAFQSVVEACKGFGITALRADGKQYADELLPNIRTYMHGCGFGIAIFERITTDDFNPNVSLEVGYMMALGKPVCLLKDQYLDSLHTDLVGRLYESFNPQDSGKTIPAKLTKWMRDKGLIPSV